MEDEKDAFYIVRKGDIIGVYRSLSECQEQAGSSVSHPAMSVYKGYGWPKEAEEFVSSFGIKNALYSVDASFVKDDVFGKLVPCPVQQPSSSQGGTLEKPSLPKSLQETVKTEILQPSSTQGGTFDKPSAFKRPQETVKTDNLQPLSSQGGTFNKPSPPKRPRETVKTDNLQPSSTQGRTFDKPSVFKIPQETGSVESRLLYPSSPPQKLPKIETRMVDSCIIEFDGASKGNPGKAGAGAVLRTLDKKHVLFYLREGVGIATNNVAEYRALILGLKTAFDQGFRNVRVQGDSMLVCMQIQDKWKTKHPKMAELCEQAKELKSKFKSFHIQHIAREFNSDADIQANEAIHLEEGETRVIAGGGYVGLCF